MGSSAAPLSPHGAPWGREAGRGRAEAEKRTEGGARLGRALLLELKRDLRWTWSSEHTHSLLVTLCHVPTATAQGLALVLAPKCLQPGLTLD